MKTSMILNKKRSGFTLLELLITVAIVGILASVAYPSYKGVLEKTRRQEAVRTLLEAAQYMESYYAMNLNYSGAVAASKVTGFTSNDEFTDYYALTAVAGTTTFTLSAAPLSTGAQSTDACGTLTVTNTGATSAGSTECW